jgi:hypothetical protein
MDINKEPGKIYGFGDSHTQGHILDRSFPPYIMWKESLGTDLPPVWIDLLGEKLKMEVLNFGEGGLGNDEIFFRICEQSKNFKSGDLVLIYWSYMERFRWASKETLPDGNVRMSDTKPNEIHRYWKRLSSHPQDGEHINEQTRKDIVLNRSNPMYHEIVYTYENIIDALAKSVGFDVFYWSTENELIYNLPEELLYNKKYILHDIIKYTRDSYRNVGGDFFKTIIDNGGQTIFEETKRKISDFHLGGSGHRVQFELFYEYLTRFWR